MNYTFNQTFSQFKPNSTADVFVYPQEILATQGFDFYGFMLFGLFMVVLFGLYTSQKRTTGRGDFVGSFVASSWFVTVVGVIMSLVTGMIGSFTILVCVTASILSTVIMMLTSRNEGV